MAQWIWSPDHKPGEVNARFEFFRVVEIPQAQEASLRIAADSRYRLFLNDEWIGDGPARSYPECLYQDEYRVRLLEGANRILVEVLHFGVDTFQYLRGEPGLMLSLETIGNASCILVSDRDWLTRRAVNWEQSVPRISCQQGFEEHFHASRIEEDWIGASISRRAGTTVVPRETPLPVHEWRQEFRLMRREPISEAGEIWSIAIRRHFSPFGKGINSHGMAGVLLANVECTEDSRLTLLLLGPVAGLFVDGQERTLEFDQDLRFLPLSLACGKHVIAVALCTEYDHSTELAIGYRSDVPLRWSSPLGERDFPWISSGPLWSTRQDSNCFLGKPPDGERQEFAFPFGGSFLLQREAVWAKVRAMACQVQTDNGDLKDLQGFAPLPAEVISTADAYAAMRFDAARPGAEESTGADPAGMRFLYDVGEITSGWFQMELEAKAGTIVDACFFEHEQDGKIQYMHQHDGISYRNSFRYVAKEGLQTFTSRQRRGFRHLMIVVRKGAASFRGIGVWESLWHPKPAACFDSSDHLLNRIHSISQRTLRLCMEDTFTDCPSYEQAFWVGDARNEALFAQWTFGACDLTMHSLRLAARSLDRLPLVASQCPSGWDVLIPSFSFLWSVAVWEAYWFSGDIDFLREMAAPMRRNLATAISCCTDRGLFSARAWNFFDWTGIDQNRETVLHNSQLLLLALDAGWRMSGVLGDEAFADICERELKRLSAAIELLWDDERGCYRDALLKDGTRSERFCQHTSFLAILAGEKDPGRRSRLLANCLTPPHGMTLTGSPNAMFFLLEALWQQNQSAKAMAILRSYWGRMVNEGATTFWEMIPETAAEFPTRSHCHGWSSSPAYLLPRLIFGVECLEAGWRVVHLRPRSFGLEFVRTSICTPRGLLHLSGSRSSSGSWDVTWTAPDGIAVTIDYES